MRTALLRRSPSKGNSTFGVLTTDSGFVCETIENTSLIIPVGTYTCLYLPSPKHGQCYHLQDVPGRTFIEIHTANFAHELLGCIAPGQQTGKINGEDAVLKSKAALADLETDLVCAPFTLTIEEMA